MRDVPASMEAIWKSGDYVGDRRPIARVTAQHPTMKLRTYGLTSTFTRMKPPPSGLGSLSFTPTLDPRKGERVTQTYADWLFSTPAVPKELPNVRSVEWERNIDSDAATCTITFFNTEPRPLGSAPLLLDMDRPGWYTPTRGHARVSAVWRHVRNEWSSMLLPDNILRTYEGYGFDPEKVPEKDTNLALTGVWMIDEVDMSHAGIITVRCRDLSRLLLDQLAFLPVTPKQFYPLTFQNWDEKVQIGNTSPQLKRIGVRPIRTSNVFWHPPNNEGSNSPNATLYGRKMAHAFDGNPASYWLSVGNSHPARRFAYEWIEFDPKGSPVSEVRFRTVGKNYTAYLSVMVNGVWQGTSVMNYHRDGIGKNDANIRYVATTQVRSEAEHVIKVPKHYGKVQKVRVTWSNLQHLGNRGGQYHYRVGVRELAAYGLVGNTSPIYMNLRPGPAGANPGRYQDYTDIVKLLCAWAGFFWPKGGFVMHSDGQRRTVQPEKSDDAVLGAVKGRVWGDFQASGTNGPSTIGIGVFDKKPLMDGINAIRDILGFVFFIDETGGVQWRLPNLYGIGNWLTGLSPNPGRTQKIYTIDERQLLVNLNVKLSSRNVREGVFVGNSSGHNTSMVGGFNPNQTGLRRVGGWLDQNFESKAETQLMADMITVRQLFTYRQDSLTIPGFPGIQIDDQIRLMERVTSETYLHYVKGIASSLDMTTGEYTYNLQTHWLGERLYDRWVLDPAQLAPETRRFISEVGQNTPFEAKRGGIVS